MPNRASVKNRQIFLPGTAGAGGFAASLQALSADAVTPKGHPQDAAPTLIRFGETGQAGVVFASNRAHVQRENSNQHG
jgi:hypothetical protein